MKGDAMSQKYLFIIVIAAFMFGFAAQAEGTDPLAMPWIKWVGARTKMAEAYELTVVLPSEDSRPNGIFTLEYQVLLGPGGNPLSIEVRQNQPYCQWVGANIVNRTTAVDLKLTEDFLCRFYTAILIAEHEGDIFSGARMNVINQLRIRNENRPPHLYARQYVSVLAEADTTSMPEPNVEGEELDFDAPEDDGAARREQAEERMDALIEEGESFPEEARDTEETRLTAEEDDTAPPEDLDENPVSERTPLQLFWGIYAGYRGSFGTFGDGYDQDRLGHQEGFFGGMTTGLWQSKWELDLEGGWAYDAFMLPEEHSTVSFGGAVRYSISKEWYVGVGESYQFQGLYTDSTGSYYVYRHNRLGVNMSWGIVGAEVGWAHGELKDGTTDGFYLSWSIAPYFRLVP